MPLETEAPEQAPQGESPDLREKAANHFCLESTEDDVLVALSPDWVPVVSEAMLGEELAPDADGVADLMREFGSQAFGTVQSTLAAEGLELPSVQFEAVGPETAPSVPAGATWRVSFSAEHDDKTLRGIVAMPAQDEPESDPSVEEVEDTAGESFTERASSNPSSGQRTTHSTTSPDSDSEVEVSPATFGELGEEEFEEEEVNNFGLLAEVDLEVRVELGRRQLPLADVLKLTTGSVVELEKMVGEPLSVYANGRLIAKGEAVVIDEQFGVRITNLASEEARNKAFF